MIQDAEKKREHDRPAVLLIEPDPSRRLLFQQWLERSPWRSAGPAELAISPERLRDFACAAVLASADALGARPPDRVAELRRVCDEAGQAGLLVYGAALDGAARAALLRAGADEVVAADAPDEELALRLARLLERKSLSDELVSAKIRFRDNMVRQQQLVSRVRRRNRKLRAMAITDPQTGLRNARYFHQWLDTQFEIARRYKLVLSVLMIDIDHFKRINDTCGHPFGDYVLAQFAEILRTQARASDVVGRLGGDEFAIGLVETGRQDAVRFARRLLRAVASSSFSYFGQTESITISIGQSGYPEDVEAKQSAQLLLFADQALYRAKAQGRNDLVCWHEIEPSVRRRLAVPPARGEDPAIPGGSTLCLFDPQQK